MLESKSVSLGIANKYSDIIATNGSPLADIQELLNVDFVMKAGKVIKHN